MDTFVHADIFFFVTTIAVIVVSAVLAVALIYLIKVLVNIKKITGQVREEAVLFREDLRGLRTKIRAEEFKLKHLVNFALKMIRRKKVSRSKKES